MSNDVPVRRGAVLLHQHPSQRNSTYAFTHLISSHLPSLARVRPVRQQQERLGPARNASKPAAGGKLPCPSGVEAACFYYTCKGSPCGGDAALPKFLENVINCAAHHMMDAASRLLSAEDACQAVTPQCPSPQAASAILAPWDSCGEGTRADIKPADDPTTDDQIAIPSAVGPLHLQQRVDCLTGEAPLHNPG